MSTKKTEPIRDECFIIMQMSEKVDREPDHFQRVYEEIFQEACKAVDLKAVRGDDVKVSNIIHRDIIKRIIESPMVICDLTGHNPNVLFELSFRLAFNKPYVLVQEKGTPAIFDVFMVRIIEYQKGFDTRHVGQAQKDIVKALQDTIAEDKSGKRESLLSQLGIENPYRGFSELVSEATMKDQIENFEARLQKLENRVNKDKEHDGQS